MLWAGSEAPRLQFFLALSSKRFQGFGDERHSLIYSIHLQMSSGAKPKRQRHNPVGQLLGTFCTGAGFSVAFDPLDGSSVVDTNFSVGTIFGIWPGDKLTGVTGRDQVRTSGKRRVFMPVVVMSLLSVTRPTHSSSLAFSSAAAAPARRQRLEWGSMGPAPSTASPSTVSLGRTSSCCKMTANGSMSRRQPRLVRLKAAQPESTRVLNRKGAASRAVIFVLPRSFVRLSILVCLRVSEQCSSKDWRI